MSYLNPTTSQINPRVSVTRCDQCGENPARFVIGIGLRVTRLCALCGVHVDLNTLHPIEARRLQAARLQWITTPNHETDVDDETFAATHYTDPARVSQDDDAMVERYARKVFVAMLTGEEAPA